MKYLLFLHILLPVCAKRQLWLKNGIVSLTHLSSAFILFYLTLAITIFGII